ncbi:uncharacterized protein MYCFIDRAFT_209139 [Pseudocercospora fijiensis CIRAD86]|uniref:Uncharacterized protein n=1 Tax=Pseudocercospora fijiensis (strain CIRAD86) TaxID=383855 RepID=M2ZZP3_PSEFD|nr:uncharacterized protein MYCFIDRAFT_209139 [Pseudocercospora fijiensis CIRAD86]EME77631.1 hypothetical protein MYCFIDRAFT_209139 [Pseudocercospora fijiensis CIRAD86]
MRTIALSSKMNETAISFIGFYQEYLHLRITSCIQFRLTIRSRGRGNCLASFHFTSSYLTRTTRSSTYIRRNQNPHHLNTEISFRFIAFHFIPFPRPPISKYLAMTAGLPIELSSSKAIYKKEREKTSSKKQKPVNQFQKSAQRPVPSTEPAFQTQMFSSMVKTPSAHLEIGGQGYHFLLLHPIPSPFATLLHQRLAMRNPEVVFSSSLGSLTTAEQSLQESHPQPLRMKLALAVKFLAERFHASAVSLGAKIAGGPVGDLESLKVSCLPRPEVSAFTMTGAREGERRYGPGKLAAIAGDSISCRCYLNSSWNGLYALSMAWHLGQPDIRPRDCSEMIASVHAEHTAHMHAVQA